MTSPQPDHSLADAVCAAHVSAWRESRFSVVRYCRQQRIARAVFVRWVMAVEAAESPVNAEELSPRARRRERGIRLPTTMKNQATQAFWAMHVEALNWSGMRLRAYANALHLSHYSLKKWRDRIAAGKVEGDWRRLLHPSARPPLSTSARPSATRNPGKPLDGHVRRRSRIRDPFDPPELQPGGEAGCGPGDGTCWRDRLGRRARTSSGAQHTLPLARRVGVRPPARKAGETGRGTA